jgi:hypothetical protein
MLVQNVPARRHATTSGHHQGGIHMGIGVSVFLFAVGAILTFAVNATVSGLDIATVGVILMVAGALGLIMTVAVFGRRGGSRQTVVEEYDDVDGRRRVVRDDIL